MELTDVEKEAIARMLRSPSGLEAMRKVFEEIIGDIRIDFEVTNEEIGARLRARYEAEQMINRGFRNLENYRQVEEPKPEDNPAR